MIKIMLKRRKESDTYLAADRRHCRSMQIAMKVDKVRRFLKAVVLKSTHFIYFHSDLHTPAMSSVSSQVGVTLFLSF